MGRFLAFMRGGSKPAVLGLLMSNYTATMRNKQLENPWKKHDNIPL